MWLIEIYNFNVTIKFYFFSLVVDIVIDERSGPVGGQGSDNMFENK